MNNISIIYTLKNRADLLRFSLEGLSRQDYDMDKVEVCIGDGASTDNLMNILDLYSDTFKITYAISDRSKSLIPVRTNCPAADLNAMIDYMPTFDYVIKTDPEVVMLDNWILQEISERLDYDDTRCYNARTHFTTGKGWYSSFEDIVNEYEQHYMIAEGSQFSRSKFWFLSGFSRTKFINMGGIDERFVTGDGWEDNCFREHWKTVHGNYEFEISGQACHLFHDPTPNHSLSLYELNRRQFEQLKNNPFGNAYLETDENGEQYWRQGKWGNVEMLSKLYTIHKGQVINVEDLTGDATDAELPF